MRSLPDFDVSIFLRNRRRKPFPDLAERALGGPSQSI